MNWLLRQLTAGTSLGTDDVWVVDSTPVEGARSRAVACGSARAGWAAYGYCVSHSRYLWGLCLHLIAPAHGLPVAVALTGAKADERQTLLALLADDPDLVAARRGQTLIADKHCDGRDFQTSLQQAGLRLLRPTRKGERERAGQRFRKLLHQTIESIFATANGHLDLERHHGRTPVGVLTRILQRLLVLTAVIWHNDHSGQPIKRSLLAYDH